MWLLFPQVTMTSLHLFHPIQTAQPSLPWRLQLPCGKGKAGLSGDRQLPGSLSQEHCGFALLPSPAQPLQPLSQVPFAPAHSTTILCRGHVMAAMVVPAVTVAPSRRGFVFLQIWKTFLVRF